MATPTGGSAVGPRRRRFRVVAGVLLLAGVVWLLVSKRADALIAWQTILAASPGWIAVSVLLGFAFLVNQALFHRAAQRALDVHLPVGELWRSSNAAFFINTIARSGGLAGVMAFTPAAERHGQSRPRTMAAYVVVTILSQLSFAVSLMAAVVVLVRAGNLTRIDLVGSIVFGVYTLILGATVVAAIRSRSTLRRFQSAPIIAKRQLLKVLRRPVSSSTIDTIAADDFYDAVQLFRREPRLLVWPAAHALLVEALGIALLWSVLRSVGGNIGVTGALVAYSVSVMFLIISILPGGLGFVEASLGVILTGFGMATGTAAAAVVLYRVLQLWLPFAMGALAVRKATAPPKPVIAP